ncbi:hypothetical protein K7G98_28795 [Saccharothrix sp. MB29]|nr:hypothetical protein [Saccharothrix sp. MB29]
MNNPLVAERRDSTTGYTGIGIAESAADLYNGVSSGSWVEGGLGFAGTGLEMLSLALDPLGTLLQYAVSWIIEHVGPLRDALNWLAGDADQIAAYATTWQNVSRSVGRAHEVLTSEVGRGTAGWTGAAADAYRRGGGPPGGRPPRARGMSRGPSRGSAWPAAPGPEVDGSPAGVPDPQAGGPPGRRHRCRRRRTGCR